MLWPQVFTDWLITDSRTALAERVACRSRLAVWQRVMHRLDALGPTEARGYVRARAAVVIAAETDRLIEQEGSRVARVRAKIESLASELLIHMIVAQLEQRRLAEPHRRRVA
jgi:hypothetical protein